MVNDSLKINGIAGQLPDNPIYFTQISIPEILILPENKPDIEQLVSVTVETQIVDYHIIDTPCIKSYEGQLLTGKKLIIELKLLEKVVYVADETTQPVHAAHFDKTFRSVFIIVPNEIQGIPVDNLFKDKKLVITPYIEDIYAIKRDNRKIFKNITMLIDVTLSC